MMYNFIFQCVGEMFIYPHLFINLNYVCMWYIFGKIKWKFNLNLMDN